MMKATLRGWAWVAALVLVTAGLMLGGCSAKATPMSTGVLSTVQQQALTQAAAQALDQAKVTAKTFDKLIGKQKVHLAFDSVSDSDLGRKHVAGIVEDRIRSMSGGLSDGGKEMHCTILLAGVDVSDTNLLIYHSRKTKADVELRLSYADQTYHGTGTATFVQKWLIGATIKEEMDEPAEE
jgi:hypothetical protein